MKINNINLFPLAFNAQAKEINIQGNLILAIVALFVLFYSQIKEANSAWLKI